MIVTGHDPDAWPTFHQAPRAYEESRAGAIRLVWQRPHVVLVPEVEGLHRVVFTFPRRRRFICIVDGPVEIRAPKG
ncbi:MAG: hypothetical protein QOG92_1011, partial [Verrucomicrobiota bacterium]|nr:hypothetical protein [Verrucomicrobiota bacterium]